MIERRCGRCRRNGLRIPAQVAEGSMFYVYCGYCGARQTVISGRFGTVCRFSDSSLEIHQQLVKDCDFLAALGSPLQMPALDSPLKVRETPQYLKIRKPR